MYARLSKPVFSKSFFIFGARGTGKSTLLRQHFQNKAVFWIDLLDEEKLQTFFRHPRRFEEEILAQTADWVVVDEIQKAPVLLDYVHRLIESHKIKFALTGSSARKLKRSAANLLAGRALVNHLHPLTFIEVGENFKLSDILQYGSLPEVLNSKTEIEKKEYLRAYTRTYLKEEIREEQIVRKVEPFLRFLEVAAQSNGSILNYSKIARDSGVDSKAVERYFEILSDTLVGHYLEPYSRSLRKRQSQKAKFYFFDLGVKRALENTLNVDLNPSTYAYGRAFEHFFIVECMRLNDYFRKDYRFSYLRTKDDFEIDLIVERPGLKELFIEIKSTGAIDEITVNKYKTFKRETKIRELWIVSNDGTIRKSGDIWILPWKEALHRLFA